MTMHRLKTIACAAALSAGAALGTPSVHADALDSVLRVGQATTEAAQQSQQKIDQLADATRDLLTDYKTVMKQVDGLRVYNARLEKQIANQETRIGDIEESIQQVTVIQRQITPLVIRMIDALEQFIALDVPFHLEERQERIAFLRANLDRSDLSVAERFRQVLEAYKIESEFGRKIDSYKGTVEINGSEREVNFLRIGRIALMYQTTDTEISGVWNQESRSWEQLDSSEYRNAIMNGLRIANKQASIDIMKVPAQAPEAAK